MNAVNPLIPPGYRQNAAGHLVPEEAVSPLDIERDDLVRAIFAKGRNVHATLRAFKRAAFDDIYAFLELVGDKYNTKIGGTKGNVSLTSFDGRFKVEINTSDLLVIGESIHAAKALVDTCVLRWTNGSRPEVRALIDHAFQTDKKGRFNVGRLLTLARLEFDDEDWKHAVQAIKDSIDVRTTKPYLRLYERRAGTEIYEPLALDIAAL
jgi:hypothetical protein